jgi:hypothetical protein
MDKRHPKQYQCVEELHQDRVLKISYLKPEDEEMTASCPPYSETAESPTPLGIDLHTSIHRPSQKLSQEQTVAVAVAVPHSRNEQVTFSKDLNEDSNA